MNHQGTKTIETERLFLRPFRQEDAEPMFRNWASDPAVTKFLTWPTHRDVEETRRILEGWMEQYGKRDQYLWAIEKKDIREPVGSISAVEVDEGTAAVTVGYCIGRSWWGRGLTAEALRALIVFFFEEVGINSLNACHDLRNPNSGKVMQKCGLVQEGIRRASEINNQGICDVCWYSILREEYGRLRRGTAQ